MDLKNDKKQLEDTENIDKSYDENMYEAFEKKEDPLLIRWPWLPSDSERDLALLFERTISNLWICIQRNQK